MIGQEKKTFFSFRFKKAHHDCFYGKAKLNQREEKKLCLDIYTKSTKNVSSLGGTKSGNIKKFIQTKALTKAISYDLFNLTDHVL